MRIEWAENPLASKVVDLDDAEVRKLRDNLLKLFEEDREPIVQKYIAALADEHCGDCTCVASTCLKCLSEMALGVDTLRGLGKHAAHAIGGAFGDGATIDEAIKRLEAYDPQPPTGEEAQRWERVGGFERHIPRWKQQAQEAAAWLRNYRERHFAVRQ